MSARITHKQLEAFHMVVELGSVKAAGEILNVTQPAISHLLRTLEDGVGFKLFERSGRSLEMTVEGRHFFEEARLSIKAVADIEHKAEAIKLGKSGHIRLAAPPAYADGVISSIVGAYMTEHKGVFVEIESFGMAKILDVVAAGQFDIGLVAFPMRHPMVQNHPWKKTAVVCATPRDHHFASFDKVSLEQLQGEAFIQTGASSPFRYQTTELFKNFGTAPDIVAEVRSQRIALRLVEQGVGVALIDEEIARENTDGRVVRLPIDPPVNWELCFVTAKYRKSSRVLSGLLEFFMKQQQESEAQV